MEGSVTRAGEDDAELDRAFSELSAHGQMLMPLGNYGLLGNYGFNVSFGRINDRFAMSWQSKLDQRTSDCR